MKCTNSKTLDRLFSSLLFLANFRYFESDVDVNENLSILACQAMSTGK
jgi:hypothetical protein